MVILENIDIDKAILQNIDIDKISNRFKFGISNRATSGARSFSDSVDLLAGLLLPRLPHLGLTPLPLPPELADTECFFLGLEAAEEAWLPPPALLAREAAESLRCFSSSSAFNRCNSRSFSSRASIMALFFAIYNYPPLEI